MSLLDSLNGGVVVSCQPVSNGPMDQPSIVGAMACAAVAGGAVAVRVEGIENVRAVRPLVDVPLIAITKRDLRVSDVRITPSVEDVNALAACGADVIAYDATDRLRTDRREDIVRAILDNDILAMADSASVEDAKQAIQDGAAIIGTTLSGYIGTPAQSTDAPDLELVREFAKLNAFVMAEGRYRTPELVAAAINCGANAVTVGSALTRLEVATHWFVEAASRK